MSRRARIAIIGASVALALTLGSPYSCGVSEYDPPIDYAGGSCFNLLGMEFRGGFVPLLPVFVTIAIGIAAGWLVTYAISKLRSRGA